MSEKPDAPQELKDATVEEILTGKADKAFGKSNSLVSAAQAKRSILALQAATKHNLTIALDSQWRDTMREVDEVRKQLIFTINTADSAQRDRLFQLAGELQQSRAREAELSYDVLRTRKDIIALEEHLAEIERRRLWSRISRTWHRFDSWMERKFTTLVDSLDAEYDDELQPLQEFLTEAQTRQRDAREQVQVSIRAVNNLGDAFAQVDKATEEFGKTFRASVHYEETHNGSSVGE